MPAPEPSLLPGQSPPFFTVTPTDHAGIIVNVGAFCLILAAISIGIRAYVRFVIIQQRIAWDDGITLLAWVFYLIQSALVFEGIRKGLGRTVHRLSNDQILAIQQYLYADDVFYLISVWTSKIAFVLLFARTSPKHGFQRATQALIGILTVTGFVSVLLITIRCNFSRPWIWFTPSGPSCMALVTRWQVISALDIATEVMLAAMSVYLVWGLQLAISKKVSVIFAFSLRLAIIAPIVCHLHYVVSALHSDDPSISATSFVVSKQVELAYAIIAANIPVLRPFIVATTTNYGGGAEGPKGNSGSHHEMYAFGSKEHSRRTKSNNNSHNVSRAEDDEAELTNNLTTTQISAGTLHDATSVGSNDSERMIIRKDIQYSVAYNHDRPDSRRHERESEDEGGVTW